MGSREDYRRITILKSVKELFLKGSKEKISDAEKLYTKRVWILIVCHLMALVQSSGYFIQHTAFPYLTKSLDVTPQVYGYLVSTAAVAQLIGGPIVGRLADIFGAKFCLILSFTSISVSYVLIAMASNIPMLFLSRIPSVFAHSLQTTYMIISEITFQDDRADQLGKLGVSHGLGMLLGSVIGGFITEMIGIRASFVTAVFFIITCGLFALAFIPSDTKQIQSQLNNPICSLVNIPLSKETLDNDIKYFDSVNEKKNDKALNIGISEIIAVVNMPHILYLLALKVITGFPFGVLSAMFTLILLEYYNLNPRENGMVLAYLGVVGMITQGILVGLLTDYYSDEILLKFSTILMASGFLFLIISENIYLFCIASIPLTIGGSLIHVIITAIITKVVPNDKTGSALGITLCMHAIIRTIAPTIGGFLLGRVGFFAFGTQGYVVNLAVTLYLCFFGKEDFD